MQPLNFAFGGGATETVIYPLVAAAMLISIAFILILPRNKILVPFVLAVFSIPMGQVVVLQGLHFPVIRILILAVLARWAAHQGKFPDGRMPGGLNALDKAVVLWTVSALVVLNLQWLNSQLLIKSVGDFIDALGGFLAVRFLIPDKDTLRRALKVLALVCLIQGVGMVSELLTGQSVYGVVGVPPPEMRDGHIRAAGAMGALFAGSFGGVLIPVFLWLWTEKGCRLAACAGLAGATAMAFASHSSTSWMAYGASLGGLAFWPLRNRMRLIRWGLVAMLTGLHLVMHGPVWSLIEKIDVTGGSSSYHRYMLVDNCIRHFSNWWLIGYKDYGSWGFDMWDLCNQFVAVALTGGLITLVFFIMIYSRSFSAIGNARKHVDGDRKQEWLLWCLGSLMFANAVASFGINYVNHLQVLFFFPLSFISVVGFGLMQATVLDAEKVVYSVKTSRLSDAAAT